MKLAQTVNCINRYDKNQNIPRPDIAYGKRAHTGQLQQYCA